MSISHRCLWELVLLLVVINVHFSNGQVVYSCGPPVANRTINGCPTGWIKYEDSCYSINVYPAMSYADAASDCQSRFGLLLRIDTAAQFQFVVRMLEINTNDKTKPFYTSGRQDTAVPFKFNWEGHRSDVAAWHTEMYSYWLEDVPREGDGKPVQFWNGRTHALLGNNGARWGFFLRNATTPLAFICQASAATLSAYLWQKRDFEYGVMRSEDFRRSPCFMTQPTDHMMFESGRFTGSGNQMAVFECLAYGIPRPTYTWYRFDSAMKATIIDPLNEPQYSITNGKLTIHSVLSYRDSGSYACEATNELGSAMSRHAALKFGILPTFPKSSQETIVRNAFQFANIECRLSDNSNPRDMFSFQFFFSSTQPEISTDVREVRPDFRSNLFVSQSTGRLYFSEVTPMDTGYYYCTVGVTIEITGVLSQEKGPNTALIVNSGGSDETSVIVADGFPSNVPESPLRGDEVRIECIGYGPITRYRQALIYSWRRTGGLQIPDGAHFADPFKRVLVIPNAQIEDSGSYECEIEDGNRRTSGWKRIDLTINAGPYYFSRPYDIFADEGTTQRFNCKAGGTPPLTYAWFRGNNLKVEMLDNITNLDTTRFKWDVVGHLPYLEISNVKASDAAEYGCRVINSYDTIYGFAELRVLQFAPIFYKNPSSSEAGLIGKSVFLPCDVEAAPEPVRTWWFKDTELPVVIVMDLVIRECPPDAKYCLLPSGKLMISNLLQTDVGDYHCFATNFYGKANNTVNLLSVDLTFEYWPENREVLIGSVIDLPCQIKASTFNLDVNYKWRFEGTEILFGRYDVDARRYEQTQFYRPYKKDMGTLRISNIQYDYEGNYTCQAQTSFGSTEKWAYLRVVGPPGPCAGVYVPSINSTSFIVSWQMGTDHLGPITGYQIELELVASPNNWKPHTQVSESSDIIELESGIDTGRRFAIVSGLPFYHQYRLRVIALNDYGAGWPSPPSQVFSTLSGPPSQMPMNVTGSGGKIKTLTVRWQAIPREHQGGANLTYDIRYRRLGESDWRQVDGIPGKPLLDPPDHLEAAIVLPGSVKETKFVEYEVQVRGASMRREIINEVARSVRMLGEWSDVVIVRSAEEVPVSSPTRVRLEAHNATAIRVYWDPPLNYDGIEGAILGYRIVYWPRLESSCSVENNPEKVLRAQRKTVYGTETETKIVGLEPDTFYCVSVQFFNSAGDSPESAWLDVCTNMKWPADMPTNVAVQSTGEYGSIKVSWNGVRQKPREESVDGYRVRVWVTGAPAVNYTDVDAGMSDEVIVQRLSIETRYDVRVYAYSAGGIGTYSSPVVQLMIVPKARCISGMTWEAPDVKYVFVCSASAIMSSLLAACLSLLLQGSLYLFMRVLN